MTAGNDTVEFFDFYTSGPASPPLARIEELSARLIGTANGTHVLAARITLGFGSGLPAPGYEVRFVAYYRSDDGTQLFELGAVARVTNALGIAELAIGLPKDLARGAGEIHFAVLEIVPPPGAPIHAVGEDSARVQVFEY
jgi:hypothetical protein